MVETNKISKRNKIIEALKKNDIDKLKDLTLTPIEKLSDKELNKIITILFGDDLNKERSSEELVEQEKIFLAQYDNDLLQEIKTLNKWFEETY